MAVGAFPIAVNPVTGELTYPPGIGGGGGGGETTSPTIAGVPGDRFGFFQTFIGLQAMSASREYGVPFILPAGRSVSAIQVHVGTLALGSLVRVGWREDDNAWPGNLVTDFGTIDTTTTGLKSLSVSFTPPSSELFWLTLTAQGGTPSLVRASNPAATLVTIPRPTDWGTSARHVPIQDSVTGALPAGFSVRGATSAQASEGPGAVLVLS